MGGRMNYYAAEVAEARFDQMRDGFEGTVTLIAETGGKAMTHFSCFAELPKNTDLARVAARLVADAKRQMARMPEYRCGPQNFTLYQVENSQLVLGSNHG